MSDPLKLVPEGTMQIQVVENLVVTGVAAYNAAVDPESGDVLVTFDTMYSNLAARRITIPFGRLQFAQFVRRMQQAIPSNGDDPEDLLG